MLWNTIIVVIIVGYLTCQHLDRKKNSQKWAEIDGRVGWYIVPPIYRNLTFG